MDRAWPAWAPRMAKGSSSPTGEPAASSALWHSLASSSASPARPSASRTATENAALDDRPAPTGMVLVTRRAPPEGGWARATRAAARAACGGAGGVAAQRDLPRLGELVAGHPDQEAARLGGEGGLGGQVDGHGEREPLVVVGVVTDEGDPSWRAGDQHGASLTPMRPLGSRSCDGADTEKRTAQRYQDHRAGGDRALPLRRHDAGRRRRPGHPPRAGGSRRTRTRRGVGASPTGTS